MTYLVTGTGHNKSPARFEDFGQACDYARGLARAGATVSVYREVAMFVSPNNREENKD